MTEASNDVIRFYFCSYSLKRTVQVEDEGNYHNLIDYFFVGSYTLNRTVQAEDEESYPSLTDDSFV